jgi:hypothetical protein
LAGESSKNIGILVGAVGIELPRALKTRKLLILRNGKRNKNCENAKPRDTLGTQEGSSFLAYVLKPEWRGLFTEERSK